MLSRALGTLFTAWMLCTAMGLLTVQAAAPAAKHPGPNEPFPQTRTFFIAGVKTDADVQAITAAVMKVKSVTKVERFTPGSGYANITFDHHAVTHQQIAQAIAAAGDFQASLRFVIPDYVAHAEKVEAIFATAKDEAQIEATNKEKGEFTLRFLPLKAGEAGPHGIGFNFGQIAHPILDPPPKGLGLKVMVIWNAPPKATAKKPAVKKTVEHDN